MHDLYKGKILCLEWYTELYVEYVMILSTEVIIRNV